MQHSRSPFIAGNTIKPTAALLRAVRVSYRGHRESPNAICSRWRRIGRGRVGGSDASWRPDKTVSTESALARRSGGARRRPKGASRGLSPTSCLIISALKLMPKIALGRLIGSVRAYGALARSSIAFFFAIASKADASSSAASKSAVSDGMTSLR